MSEGTPRSDPSSAPPLSLDQYRLIVENVTDLVLVIDRESRIVYVNRSMLSTGEQSLIGLVGLERLGEPYRQRARDAIDQALATCQPQSVEVRTIYGHWWDCRLLPVGDQDGSPLVMIACMDVTEQKRAEEALRAEEQMLRQLLELHERDRQMTAYEIHDGFAQDAAAALMNFQAFDNFREQDPPQAQRVFERGMHLLEAGVDEARQLIAGLRPPILDESGIVAAVDHLLNPLHPPRRWDVEFRHSLPKRLPRELETTVFRIAQEAVTNARRHSESPRLRVRIAQEADEVVIEVEDWGKGFDPDAVDPSRFGIKSIRERARLAGGTAAITSRPGHGTRVEVRLPCPRQGLAAPPAG